MINSNGIGPILGHGLCIKNALLGIDKWIFRSPLICNTLGRLASTKYMTWKRHSGVIERSEKYSM